MPFPENTPTPDDLPSLSAAEIAALPVELLAILQREIDERLKRDKAAKTRFDAGLAVRYATRAAEALFRRFVSAQWLRRHGWWEADRLPAVPGVGYSRKADDAGREPSASRKRLGR